MICLRFGPPHARARVFKHLSALQKVEENKSKVQPLSDVIRKALERVLSVVLNKPPELSTVLNFRVQGPAPTGWNQDQNQDQRWMQLRAAKTQEADRR